MSDIKFQLHVEAKGPREFHALQLHETRMHRQNKSETVFIYLTTHEQEPQPIFGPMVCCQIASSLWQMTQRLWAETLLDTSVVM